MLGIGLHQAKYRFLLPALRRVNFHLAAATFREHVLQQLPIFKVHRHVNESGYVLLIQIKLLE